MKKKSVEVGTVEVTPAPPPPPPPPPPKELVDGSMPDPLYVIDGEISDKGMTDISPDEIQSISVLKDESATEKYGGKGKNGVIEITLKKSDGPKVVKGEEKLVTIRKTENPVFMVVEDMPEFPGGQEAMMPWIRSNIRYPDEARANKISGRVFLSFVVSSTGKINDVRVVRSASPLLDAEAVRVIKSMPDWKPGTQRGKAVAVNYTLAVDFSLTEDGGEHIVK